MKMKIKGRRYNGAIAMYMNTGLVEDKETAQVEEALEALETLTTAPANEDILLQIMKARVLRRRQGAIESISAGFTQQGVIDALRRNDNDAHAAFPPLLMTTTLTQPTSTEDLCCDK